MKYKEKKILVVDDDDEICSLLEKILTEKKYNVISTTEPNEALIFLEQKSFQLIITDLIMREKSGWDILEKARKLQPNSKIIMMTGFATVENAVKTLRAGAYDYIIKPFTIDIVLSAVERGLKQQELEDQNLQLKSLVSLYQISEVMTSNLGLKDLISEMLKYTVNETDCDSAAVSLISEKTGITEISFSRGIRDSRIGEKIKKVHIKMSEWVLENNVPLLLSSPNDSRRFKKISEGAGIKSSLVIPLKIKDNIVGTLNLIRNKHPEAFSNRDLKLATIIGNPIALSIENARLYESLQSSYLSTVRVMSNAMLAKDPYTRGHSVRVSRIATQLSEKLKLDRNFTDNIKFAGYLHDIGKIGISESILLKKGSLTKEEYELIKRHPEIGAKILKPANLPEDVIQATLHHHERYDGNGYPHQLKGTKIPLAARLLSVCDIFEALTSKRAYRDAWNLENTEKYIKENRKKIFDPEIAETFLKLLKKRKADFMRK